MKVAEVKTADCSFIKVRLEKSYSLHFPQQLISFSAAVNYIVSITPVYRSTLHFTEMKGALPRLQLFTY